MANAPSRARKFSSAIGDDAIHFGDHQISIAPALTKDEGGPMSAYTALFRAGAKADLPAPYAEIWVVLSGSLRVGTGSDAVTVRAGEFVHVPEQAPGIVEALEETRLICVSVPAH
ncbi:cupin domain-containing protein [Kibdelosporangium phytohabitans]|uniref:Cupin n=1 Tax=Kibdelosporangium phytohabitans TaxID=860235 RepID=A0A0N9HYE3_9PSEU|nr:cupin [Kibdelosporangium phytohabitans]ALG08334.1 cupin [Kibdelosporangium phytohabitans]MBE1470633.1 mannose-6-phosphate isomerase-like protein (cupin superfamily) [Kibdelosporangium phytohabitans]